MKTIDSLISEVEKELSKSSSKPTQATVGQVVEVKDEVVLLEGLDDVSYGELIEFENGALGLVVDLTQTSVGTIVFGDYVGISEGSTAKATGRIFSIGVGEKFLGRVVNGLGEAIDGGEKITSEKQYPVERIASGVIERQPVNTSLQTGIKAIDAAIPIGRGQRELIIGDRQTGKSTLAIDTVINQKGQDVICVYCIIGQKRSTAAALIETLRKNKALDYTIVVCATGSDPAASQYVAPYVACTLGEYFMDKGRDVIVVYDDLSKHAWAYRQVSLVLRRPSGREAYPGDIFYLHSRLLERACRLNEKLGGGSITALPIIETQEGDISAYIPTNVISITDGQIFLESDLFNSGVRPAINVGTSVSRVGSSAQTKAMKKVGGKIRFDLAQYRELAAFSQFESELDERTKKFLDRGAAMTELLKQKKNKPMSLAQQVVILWAGVNGYLDSIPVSKVVEFEEQFVASMNTNHKKLMEQINDKKALDEDMEKQLKKNVEEFVKVNYS